MHRRYALLIGVDRYPLFGPEYWLRGAVNDVEQLADLLEDRFEFPLTNIKRLHNEEATREGILDAMAVLAECASRDDTVVLHFSGHGSQIADREGDEPDGLDETLVPFDGHRSAEDCRDITDDEIYLWFDQLSRKGVFVTLILDSCHSGHALRNEHSRSRSVPNDRRSAELLAPSPIPPDVWTSLVSGDCAGRVPRRDLGVFLAACSDDQQAFERFQRADYEAAHGHWTYALLRVLRQAAGTLTARDVFEQAQAWLQLENVWQTPQIAGARDRQLFGVDLRPPARFVRVEESHGSRIKLAAGATHGLVADSLWQIHARGTKQPRDSDCLGRARITEVGALSTIAELEGDRAEIQPGSRAFQRVPAHEEMRLRVALAVEGSGLDSDSSALAHSWLTRAIAASPVLQFVAATAWDTKVLGRGSSDAGPQWQILDRQGQPLARPFGLVELWTPGGLVDRLERRARCLHARRLQNLETDSPLAHQINLQLLQRDKANGWRVASSNPEGPSYRDGDPMAFEIVHYAEEPLYVYVLDLGVNDEVSLLFPEPGAHELLEPDLPIKVGLQPGGEFDVCLPADFYGSGAGGQRGGTGFLKLFATTRPVELDWLVTNLPWPIFRQPETGLAALLAMQRRCLTWRSVVEDQDPHGEDWATMLRPYQINRAG